VDGRKTQQQPSSRREGGDKKVYGETLREGKKRVITGRRGGGGELYPLRYYT